MKCFISALPTRPHSQREGGWKPISRTAPGPKDWVDIATMHESRSLDVGVAADRLADLLGHDDPRIGRLRDVASTGNGTWSAR